MSTATYECPRGLWPPRGPRAHQSRAHEYDLLARCTQKLSMAWMRRKEDFPMLATALTENLQLWSALAADVAEKGNGLPAAAARPAFLSV